MIVGASRGIGRGLVDVHAEADWKVHATTRDGSPLFNDPDVTTHQLDVRELVQLETLISDLH